MNTVLRARVERGVLVSHHVAKLLTLNVAHFGRFAEASVTSPYEIGDL